MGAGLEHDAVHKRLISPVHKPPGIWGRGHGGFGVGPFRASGRFILKRWQQPSHRMSDSLLLVVLSTEAHMLPRMHVSMMT